MFQPLDGPSKQSFISVDATTPQQVKVGISALEDRQVITLQPIDGKLWVFFGEEGVTPTMADLQNKGFDHQKTSLKSYEAGTRQPVWILAQSGTVNVRFAERA